MSQTSYSIVTRAGRNAEALAKANGTPLVFSEIALGDGTRSPVGVETALENEIERKPIVATGVVDGAVDHAFFDIFLAAEDGPYTVREMGLFLNDGTLYAVSKVDPAFPKTTVVSGQPSEHTLRMVVIISDIANVVIEIASGGMVYVPVDRRIDTTDGITGGGDLSQNRTHRLAIEALPALDSVGDDDLLAIHDALADAPRRVAAADLRGYATADLAIAPVHGEMLTSDGRFTITDNANGTLTLDAGQTWLWRGYRQLTTDGIGDAAARTVTTVANKTYHLRIAYDDVTKTQTLSLNDLADAGYNPASSAETISDFDSDYDDILIARIVTDGANAATVTTLANKIRLTASARLSTTPTGVPGNTRRAVWTWTTNFGRTPVVSYDAFVVATSISGPVQKGIEGGSNWTNVFNVTRYATDLDRLTDFEANTVINTIDAKATFVAVA